MYGSERVHSLSGYVENTILLVVHLGAVHTSNNLSWTEGRKRPGSGFLPDWSIRPKIVICLFDSLDYIVFSSFNYNLIVAIV
jgi:hypothetical protein